MTTTTSLSPPRLSILSESLSSSISSPKRRLVLVVPCAVLALCIHPTTFHNLLNRISWAFCVYLEAISVLPQLRVMQNTKIVEPFTAHYVFALGVARDKVVYELYTDYVLKNPFYEMEMPIRFELFDINLTQAVQKDRVALLGR
ncbi:ER lumen protein-retaining receptor erd-2.2 isoform X1 [Gossypium hirsutum]|uniref:ER lumen protein-retaining receptor erd-2.2 isoform X1 n=1 Tax=Gossypium hirsutum TaxID=3635 RepID=A0ABM3B6X8_GOSHI|nr:ER lumen protein-retaining receptor erd-2.2-like isoform X1 [Gossypium hirsutum]